VIYEQAIVLTGPFDDVVRRVKTALAAEGFGTITEIDMAATLRAKIGKEIAPYLIIGACNPNLASRALDEDPQIGVLLPCNVVVRAHGHDVVVEALDPGLMATITGSPSIELIAAEARERIGNALNRLSSGTDD